MTDNEIIKALECLIGEPKLCRECPYDGTKHYPFCREHCAKDALDLIKRQQAEITDLNTYIKQLDIEHRYELKHVVNDTIETFGEKLKAEKETIDLGCGAGSYDYVAVEEIDNLVEEMVGANNDR